MKKRIIIGLGIHALIFLAGGYYILTTINQATSKLDRLIQLHQVEILREHYLIQIRRVQTDLTLHDTRYAREFDTLFSRTRDMQLFIDTCFSCHHEPEPLDRIVALKDQTDLYQNALSRMLTVRANESHLLALQDDAFRAGEKLLGQVGDMIAMTGSRLEVDTQRTMREIADTKYVLYLLVVIGPFLSTWLGFIFISSLTSPVKTLVRATKKIEEGDLDHRVVGLRDEFGEVASAMNEMAGSLKDQIQKMQRVEQMVVVGELAAGLAHEIKNPLAGIKVAMQVLSEEDYLTEEDRKVICKVGDEVVRLETLMKSFLSFARPARPNPEPIEIDAMLNTTLAFYAGGKPKAKQSRLPIEIEKQLGAPPRTLADPMQLQQVFLNLVINAIDAMPQGGTLFVRTAFEEQEQVIVVEIADTGGGVKPEDADNIFRPFFTSKPKGTGLGLAICRQLVEQHGGTIQLDTKQRPGACFVIRFPHRPVEEPTEATG
jgi:signal transduction histidine kinase